jgi:hypothetical protein
MPVTLAEAQVNAQDDVEFAVIDELRRYSWLLDQIPFDQAVSPGTAGATLTYGYTRLVTAASAAFRAINSEYTAGKATRQRFTTDLKPLGGSFEIDRVLANLGETRTNEQSFQVEQLLRAIRTKFQDELVNGDTAVDANGFDGLDNALTGSSTEIVPNSASTAFADWTAATVSTEELAHSALDLLDELVDMVEGGADAILGNRKGIQRVRSIARRAGYYTRSEDALGRRVEMFGNSVLVDLGENADGSGSIIPTESRDVADSPDAGAISGLTDLYAVRFGMDGYHAVSVVNTPLLQVWLPDFSTSGAVKTGEAEMGPLSGVLKATKAAAVLRNLKVQ